MRDPAGHGPLVGGEVVAEEGLQRQMRHEDGHITPNGREACQHHEDASGGTL